MWLCDYEQTFAEGTGGNRKRMEEKNREVKRIDQVPDITVRNWWKATKWTHI